MALAMKDIFRGMSMRENGELSCRSDPMKERVKKLKKNP